MDSRINIGLVGCGRIANKHFETFKLLEDKINFKAICDRSPEKLKEATLITGAKSYIDFDEMLVNEKIDLLAVTTPNGLHAGQIIKASKFVKNIVTEKPLAIKWQDGVDACKACEDNGANLFVIYQNRFNETAQAVHKAIQDGRFGRIYMIVSNVFWQRPQEYYDQGATWHGTLDLDGGAYMTQASHYIDMMQWFVNAKPKRIYANLVTLARKIETEDCGVAVLEWDNGTLGNINLTVLTFPKNLEGSITIIGEKGTVQIGGIALNNILRWDFADHRPEDDLVKNYNYETTSVYGNGHIHNYENIINTIKGTEKALIDGREGLKSLKILTSLYESNARKQAIDIL